MSRAHLLLLLAVVGSPFTLSTQAYSFDPFGRPTVTNPITKRRIHLGGFTYRAFMKEGAWVQHGGTLRRLDLAALKQISSGRDQGSPAPARNDDDACVTESEIWQWHFVAPHVLPASSDSSSEDNIRIASTLSDHLLFVNKPSGLHCVPPRDLSDSLSDQMSSLFPGSKPCHRLDRDTSGIVLFGRTAEAHRAISKQFEARTTWKQYTALVSGHPKHENGTISIPIGKIKTEEGFKRWALGRGEKMREAITEWRVDERFMVDGVEFSRLLLEPKTGRGHQLRLHLKSMGHPILGDTIHGEGGVSFCSPRLCLHAFRLQVTWNGLRLEAESVSPF